MAGGVDDQVVEVAAGDPLQLLLGTRIRLDRLFHTELLTAEGEPVLAEVECCDLGATDLGEDHRRHADRPGAEDEDPIASRRVLHGARRAR